MMMKVKNENGISGGCLSMIFFCLVMMAVADVTVSRAEDTKIGIIDTARIVLQSQYAQKVKADFTAEMEEQRNVLDKKREEAEKQRQKVLSLKEAGKDSAATKKQEKELEKMVRELKWLKEDFDKDLVEMDNALLEKMKERVRKVLDQFIATTDYCIIMEKQRVAVYCKTVDVTDEIIKRLDNYRE
ncbi:MAG: OmpH family outer membrane protein [Thermodesulfobacteriota bacterium]